MKRSSQGEGLPAHRSFIDLRETPHGTMLRPNARRCDFAYRKTAWKKRSAFIALICLYDLAPPCGDTSSAVDHAHRRRDIDFRDHRRRPRSGE
ncbi:hypothetical protein WI665_12935 [Vibrio cholerae]